MMLFNCRILIGLHIGPAIARVYVPRASGTRLRWRR